MIRDLRYPEDARHVVDSLHRGLQYDAAVAVLGKSRHQLGSANLPDLGTGFKFGGRQADEAVRRDAPGLLSRFSLISMVSRTERHAQLLLLQRRVIEKLGPSGRKIRPELMWRILRQVHQEARGGPVKVCSELVVTKPSPELLQQIAWLGGIVKVRNCPAHRLGNVSIEDVKPTGVTLEATKDTDTLKVVWLRLKASINGKEIETFPHQGGGDLQCEFVQHQREWKIGDQIEVTPEECQAIGLSLSLLGNRLLAEFESEINACLASWTTST